MGPLGAAPWHPERFCFIATALSASTGVTAPDKVDRLEARTAFRAPEPDARPEAVAVVEPGAPQAAGVAAEPGAPQEAAVVAAGPDAQREAAAPDAAVAAEPDAQREAAGAAVSGAQREAAVAAVSDAQRAAAAAVSDAQREAAAASDAQQAAVVTLAAVAIKLRVRPLVASVEPAEMVVRLWFPARLASVLGREQTAKEQAPVDR